MLSNPSSNLLNRQRQHRRQNSTPTAFDSLKITSLPNIQRHPSHRRGMSLDQQRQRQTPPQDLITVNSTNNQGYQTTPQHILRETQQHRLARPDRRPDNYDNDEMYLNSPSVTPQRQSFDAGNGNVSEGQDLSSFSFPEPINTSIPLDMNSFGLCAGSDFNLYSADGSLTPSAFLDFSAALDTDCGMQSSGHNSKRSSMGRRISGGIADRVSQFEGMALQSPLNQRPITPPNQDANNYFPPTPAETPYTRIKHEPTQQRFLDSYDTSMEETIKPKANQRARGVFEEMRQVAEMSSMPSPPHTESLSPVKSFDSAPMPTASFMNLTNANLQFMNHDPGFESSNYSPTSTNMSYQSSPEMSHQSIVQDPFRNTHLLQAPVTPSDHSHGFSASSPSQSTFRRSESVSSMNLEETITDTGITVDDIAHYISGPDEEGKWLCLYPECQKRFGRKENIKSHVQTHLGDRQFQCLHCHKCFVRQHDLKRHAKIHSGIKPYPCQCGNSFARHDALTRHRQRGMCIGAFEGVVKKPVKRGRPRKHRPDDEQRLKKSSRTRAKNQGISSASSNSGYSSTSGQSPRSEAEDLDDRPFANFDNIQSFSMIDNNNSFDFSQPSPLSFPSDHVSPRNIQVASSPSALSYHSIYSDHPSVDNNPSSPPASPAKSVYSQYHSPPELIESSSSPAAQFYDFDDTPTHGGDSLVNLSGLANISEADEEMFFEAVTAAGVNVSMSQLEKDPTMLMSKYDAFAAVDGDDLFKDAGADVFFGNP